MAIPKKMALWKKILISILFAISVIFVILYINFNKSYISNNLPTAEYKLKISPGLKNKIDSIVSKDEKIVGIQVVTIDFSKNTRIETFMSIDNLPLQVIYNKYIDNKIIETPVFSQDKKNDERILKLIAGDFICMPFKESTAYKYAPSAQTIITTVCGIAIPPDKNRTTAGILTIYINSQLTPEQTETIFLLARELATIIAEQNKLYENSK